MIGQTVSHYRIVAQLGAGGMGVVYRAEDLSLGRPVALKLLPPHLATDPEARQRLLQEAKAAASLEHPGICTVYEVGEHEGRLFVAMALVEGRTLRELIAEGPLPLPLALELAAQVAEALHEAHAKGIVHRDVKPANIMLTPQNRAKLLDFGLAQLAGSSRLTRTGTTLGTAAYLAPEQARAEAVDHRTDVWALGATLFEMVTGHRPFRGEHDAALIYSILHESPQPLTALRAGVPLELDGIVGKCLEKDPESRRQSADELAADLRRLAAGLRQEQQPAASAPDDAAEPVPRRPRVRRLLRLGLPAILALSAAVFFLLRPLLLDDVLASAPKPIAVIAFENRTGDPAYDHLREAIPNLLITSLEQSKYLRVVTWERLRDLLKQVGQEDIATIDQDAGFQVCRLDGVGTIVLGSFTRAGEAFATDVKVLDVATKELLASASSRGRGVDSILESQIDEISRKVSRTLGLSERRIEAATLPVADRTTTSMDAYNCYLLGRRDWDRIYLADAARWLERAVAIDSTFAMAHALLGRVHDRLWQPAASRRAFEQAKRFRQGATEREQLYIDALYAQHVQGDGEKAAGIWRKLVSKYPGEKEAWLALGEYYRQRRMHPQSVAEYEHALALDPTYGPALNLIAYGYTALREYEKALLYFRRYAEASPGDANPLDSMGELYFHLGRLDEATAKYAEASAVRPDFGAQRQLAYIWALQADWRQSAARIDEYLAAVASPSRRAEALTVRGGMRGYQGQTEAALRDLDAADAIWDSLGMPTQATGSSFARSFVYLARADFAAAQIATAPQPDGAPSSSAHKASPALAQLENLFLCLIDLRQGELESARRRLRTRTATGADDRTVEDEPWQVYLPNIAAMLEAELLLAEGVAEASLRAAQTAQPLDEFKWGAANVFVYNFPVERDVAARAFLRTGDAARAITEYERLVTFDPGQRDRLLVLPIYHYRLAKLYGAAGRAADAATQYRKFLDAASAADIWQAEIAEARAADRRAGGRSRRSPSRRSAA